MYCRVLVGIALIQISNRISAVKYTCSSTDTYSEIQFIFGNEQPNPHTFMSYAVLCLATSNTNRDGSRFITAFGSRPAVLDEATLRYVLSYQYTEWQITAQNSSTTTLSQPQTSPHQHVNIFVSHMWSHITCKLFVLHVTLFCLVKMVNLPTNVVIMIK